jgi:MFS family permease
LPYPHSLRALESPNFRHYYIGQAVSMLGTWIQSVAMMWLAYRLSGSTWFTGTIGFLNSAPHLFLATFAGVLGDRVSRRRMLITVLTLLSLQAAVLAVLSGLGIITMPQLAVLALFAGVCNAFETPTRQSIFVQLLDRREDLANAIAMNSVLMNGTRLIGPSIGGLLIAAFGETVCFSLNAVSYVAVLVALFQLKIVNPRPKRAASHPLADLAEGWKYAMGMVPVRRMLFTLAAVSFALAPYSTLMPAMAVQAYHQGAELVGLFIGAVGLGAVISAVSLARRPSVRGLG